MDYAREPFQQPTGTVVYGMTIQDAVLAGLARKVITLSIIAAVFVVGNGIYTLSAASATPTSTAFAVFGIGAGLLVPACGYFSAKNGDANLACLFCGCSCLGFLCGVWFLCAMVVSLMLLGTFAHECMPGHETSVCPSTVNFSELCKGIVGHESDTPRACWDYFEVLYNNMHDAMPFFVGFRIVPMLLQFCSFMYGNKLYSHLKSGFATPAVPVQYVTNAGPPQAAH